MVYICPEEIYLNLVEFIRIIMTLEFLLELKMIMEFHECYVTFFIALICSE